MFGFGTVKFCLIKKYPISYYIFHCSSAKMFHKTSWGSEQGGGSFETPLKKLPDPGHTSYLFWAYFLICKNGIKIDTPNVCCEAWTITRKCVKHRALHTLGASCCSQQFVWRTIEALSADLHIKRNKKKKNEGLRTQKKKQKVGRNFPQKYRWWWHPVAISLEYGGPISISHQAVPLPNPSRSCFTFAVLGS